MKEYIAAGTTKDEFLRRLNLALGGSAPAQDANNDVYGDGAPSSSSSANQESQPSPHIQSLLAERATRLEADKKAKEAAAKAEAKKRAEERRAVNEENEGQAKNVNAAENQYAAQLRKKKQDAKAERERILRRIEDDKRERREREAQERQARLLLAATEGEETPSRSTFAPVQQPESVQLLSRGGGAHCNLQVRLLDGSTIRNRFPSGAKLGTEVREWIDENRTDSDEPYTFRIVLTPLPNKAVEPSEEADSLLDLGLAPSSTLVLVPRVRVATAFQQTGGALYRAWSGVWALVAMLLNLPLSLVGGRARDDRSGGEIPLENLDGQGSARRGQDQRVRGFDNPDDRRRDQQLYNGNSVSPVLSYRYLRDHGTNTVQLNFEPRGDEDEQET